MRKDNSGFIHGLLAGLAVVAISVILYLINPALFLKLWYVKIFIVLGFMVYNLYLYKKKHDDLISFRHGMKNTYAVWLVAFLFWFVFKFVLFNHIDPALFQQKLELDKQTMGNAGLVEDPNHLFMKEIFTTFIIGLFYAAMVSAVYTISMKPPSRDTPGANT